MHRATKKEAHQQQGRSFLLKFSSQCIAALENFDFANPASRFNEHNCAIVVDSIRWTKGLYKEKTSMKMNTMFRCFGYDRLGRL